MGDSVESLAKVEVENIHGSPLPYPASPLKSCEIMSEFTQVFNTWLTTVRHLSL